jgi:transcription initiation factor TFIIB
MDLEVSASNTHISYRIFLNSWLLLFTLAAKYQNRRNMRSSDRTLIATFNEICTMADRINLPKTIVDRAKNMFHWVHHVRTMPKLCLVCILRIVKKEICALSKISKKDMGRFFKLTS